MPFRPFLSFFYTCNYSAAAYIAQLEAEVDISLPHVGRKGPHQEAHAKETLHKERNLIN